MARLLRKARDWWINSRLMSANYQEELDTYKLASLLKYKEAYDSASPGEAIQPNPLKLSYSKQRAFISSTFDRELERLFAAVHEMGGLDPYPAPVIEKLPEEEHLTYEEIAERRSDIMTETEARKQEAAIVDRPLPHPEGFKTQISYSSIEHPSAGFGVYVKEGNIIPGTVLGVYPGIIFTPEAFPLLNKDSEYMLSGYDGILIDADGWSETAIEVRRTLRKYSNLSVDPPQLKRYRNPFAISHYINHPPKGKEANVMAFAFSFKKDFPEHLKPYIPHEYKQKPKWYYGETADLRTMVITASTLIESGEELFLDYRYNPSFPYPDWYHPHDEEAAKRRWAPTRIIY